MKLDEAAERDLKIICPFCGFRFVHMWIVFPPVLVTCPNGSCVGSNLNMSIREWDKAYCWKELEKAEQRITQLQEELRKVTPRKRRGK